MRAEDLINKCVEGRAAKDVIRSLEEETLDPKSVRLHILRDFRLAGVPLNSRDVTVESACIKIDASRRMHENSRSNLMRICDVYSRTYPEINVLVALK